MKTISSAQVRHEWRKVAAGVARGERFLVKNRNTDVALIVPVEPARGKKSQSENVLAGTARYRDGDLLRPETEDWEEA